MYARKALIAAAFFAAAAFIAACGTGGSGGGSPNPPGGGNPGPSPTPDLLSDSVNAMNAAGAIALSDQYLEMAQESPKNSGGGPPNGNCRANGDAGFEFFVPDRNHDPYSSERLVFYDGNCTPTDIALDVVRKYTTLSSTSETVTRNITRWTHGDSNTPVAVRTETINYSGVTDGFDNYGYPNLNAPLTRTSTSTFNLTPHNGSAFTVFQDDEFIAGAPTTGGTVLPFCADTAAVNQAGNYGMQAQTDPSGGTITDNADGSATFVMTRQGYSYPSGSLQLQVGTANKQCPITQPLYSISGGNTPGQYTLPISITVANLNQSVVPQVVNLQTTGASFPNGETLTISTTTTSGIVAVNGTLSNLTGTIRR